MKCHCQLRCRGKSTHSYLANNKPIPIQLQHSKQPTMSQTVQQEPMEENSDQCPASNQLGQLQGTRPEKREKTEGRRAGATETGTPMVQRLVVVSIAVSLEKMRGSGGTSATNELIDLLHNDNFNLELFRRMIKSSSDCRSITQGVIEQCKATD